MAIDLIKPEDPLNRYLWSQITAEGILSSSNYGGLVPIMAVEEVPEFMTIIDAQPGVGSHPYIVYVWSKVNTGVSYFIKQHEIAYVIRSTDDDKTIQLLKLFERLFQDYDRAAIRLNEFNLGAGGRPAHRAYYFHHISISTMGGPMPAESENESNESIVTLRVAYSGG